MESVKEFLVVAALVCAILTALAYLGVWEPG